MLKYFAAATALALVSSPVMAQDADSYFNGGFVGGQLGWGKRSLDRGGFDQSRDGLDYGAYAGYDATLGTNFVLGAEAGIGGGGKTLSQTTAGVGTTSINPDWNWNVSGRAGFLASPQLLFYGRVGYGRERIKTSFTSAVPAVASTVSKDWSDGAIYGGGIEYALQPNVSVRAEYRYSDFDGGYHPKQALLGVSYRF